MWWLCILLCAYQFIYKYRRLKAEVIKTNFLGNDMPKKICIYLEKCKYKTKKYEYPNS